MYFRGRVLLCSRPPFGKIAAKNGTLVAHGKRRRPRGHPAAVAVACRAQRPTAHPPPLLARPCANGDGLANDGCVVRCNGSRNSTLFIRGTPPPVPVGVVLASAAPTPSTSPVQPTPQTRTP